MHDAARAVRSDIIVLCHGGPIAEPEDAEYVLAHTTGIAGFFGASSIERLATESGIEAQARRFRDMKMPMAAKPKAKADRARATNHAKGTKR
jgi:predicted TIM-barrel enzyme